MTEADLIKKYALAIFKPEEKATGITVFLPGTMIDLDKFSSIYEALVKQNQIVIGFRKLNPFTKNHQKMAENAAAVVQEFRAIKGNESLPEKYNLVGHSLGGKVALMVAAKYGIDNVNKVIAIDPVDDKPRELTAPRLSPETKLSDSKAAEIHLFQSENGGCGIVPLAPSDRNATVVMEVYPDQITSLFINEGAGHMAYLDSEEGAESEAARASVIAKIIEVIQ